MAFVTPSLGVKASCFQRTLLEPERSTSAGLMLRMYSSPQAAARSVGGCGNLTESVWHCICRGPFFEDSAGQQFCLQRHAKHLWQAILGVEVCERETHH